MPLFRPIIKGASYLGKGTKVDDPVGPIPDDLKLAVRYFYISTALRNLRGQINKPNSMLVHVVRFVGQQNIIKRKVQDYRDELESYIRYNDAETYEEFQRIWNSDYLPTHSDLQSSFSRYMDGCTMPEWPDIWNEICRIVQDKEIPYVPLSSIVAPSAGAASASVTPKSLPKRGSLPFLATVSKEGIAIPTSIRIHSARQSILFAGQNFILVLMKGLLSSHKNERNPTQ